MTESPPAYQLFQQLGANIEEGFSTWKIRPSLFLNPGSATATHTLSHFRVSPTIIAATIWPTHFQKRSAAVGPRPRLTFDLALGVLLIHSDLYASVTLFHGFIWYTLYYMSN